MFDSEEVITGNNFANQANFIFSQEVSKDIFQEDNNKIVIADNEEKLLYISINKFERK